MTEEEKRESHNTANRKHRKNSSMMSISTDGDTFARFLKLKDIASEKIGVQLNNKQFLAVMISDREKENKENQRKQNNEL